jgi:TonB-linked SusC/RagA family outer membrane protein
MTPSSMSFLTSRDPDTETRMSNPRHHFILTAATALLAALGAATAGAQQGGSIAGRVTDTRSGQAAVGATIEVVGTALAATTDDDGRYRIANVPAGRHTITARRIGYALARQSVTVAGQGQTTADFALQPTALSLDAVVVTGTAGGEQLRSIGNAVSTINAAEALSLSAAPDIGTLLNGRSPGVVLASNSGRVGAGPAILIRGRSSIGLGNSPLLYINGARINNAVGVGPSVTGGFSSQNSQVGGRLNDIPPEDIERIEIIKGPAAATIYGTEASSGVIHIITKKGVAGPKPQVALQVQQGAIWFRDAEGRMPTNFAACDANDILANSLVEACRGQAVGTIVTWNGIQQENRRGRTLFTTGNTSLVNGSISGGRNDVRYYLSSAFGRDRGVEPNNKLQQFTLHANVDVSVNPKLDVSTSLNYVDLRSHLGNDAGASAMLGAMFGHSALFPTSRGFALGFLPEVTQELWDNSQNVNRLTASGRVEHLPFTWLRHRLQLGVDYTGDDSRALERFVPAELAATLSPATAAGRIGQTLRRAIGITADYSATASSTLTGALSQAASVGVQAFRLEQDTSFLGGTGFPGPGIETVSGAAQQLTATQVHLLNTTVGIFAQEKLNWRDRLYLTGAVRVDNNSAFGEDFDWVTYPKVDVSWVVSEEPFWRWGRAINALRLRAAYGESGRQPPTFIALQTFTPTQGPGGSNAVTPGSIGNADLRPERGKEIELGFEAGFLDRVSVDFTYFSKRTTDVIINQAVAPSTGFSGNRPVNLGRVDNDGVELSATANLLRRADVQWELFGSVATNGEVIKDLGGLPSLISASGQFNRVGYPINGIFAKRVVSADRDPATQRATNVLCDGGPGQAPIACAQAPFLFIGTPTPKWSGAVANTVTLFSRLRLYALLDFKGGHRLFNNNEILRCTGALGAGLCEANYFPERYSPVYLAATVGNASAQGIVDQYYQSGSFVKLREVSASYTVPPRWVWGASAATVSIAARELHTWTDYRGLDPEVNSAGAASAFLQDQAVTPPLSRLIATINLRF